MFNNKISQFGVAMQRVLNFLQLEEPEGLNFIHQNIGDWIW